MIEFGISNETVAFLGVTTYLLGIAAGSPFVAPLSEMYGRRPVLLVGMAIFLLLVIPAAVAPNFASVLIVRFIGAAFGSVMLTNSPGSLGDVATEETRASLLGVWTIGQACGPVVRLPSRFTRGLRHPRRADIPASSAPSLAAS